MTDPTRRRMFGQALAMALPGTAALASESALGQASGAGNRPLVVFMSRSGNTRVVAGQIARERRAVLFELTSLTPYPEDYFRTVEQARRETETNDEPALREEIPGVRNHSVVFLGFPIWGMTLPPLVRTFLTRHDLAGKSLIPFMTHGGYGTGNALSLLAKLAPKARLLDAFVLEADQERRTLERVTQWLDRSPSRR